MHKVIVQVPMDTKLRDQATKVAKKNGFNSLQGLIRVFLVQIATNKLTAFFVQQTKRGKTVSSEKSA